MPNEQEVANTERALSTAAVQAAGVGLLAAALPKPPAMAEEPQQAPQRSVSHAAITGAGIGAVLYPALSVVFGLFSKTHSLDKGNRLKFLSSQAAFGAVLNGSLNAAIAWGQNKIAAKKYSEKYSEKITQERSCGCSNTGPKMY